MEGTGCLAIMVKRQNEVKKLFFGTILLTTMLVFPVPAMAEVNVGVSISLPLPIVFAAPPEMVVIPETYVYVVPDIDEEIYFYNGWWWRPWEGRWYRSRHYDSGWAYYRRAPSFYGRVPSSWRDDYRQHRWGEHQWDYQRIPHQQVQQNWNRWEKNRHWEKQQTWGVQGLQPRTRTKQPAQAVRPKSQARPPAREVEQQQSQPQAREVKSQRPKRQSKTVQPQTSRPQPEEVQSQHAQPQPEGGKRPPDRPQSEGVQTQQAQPQHREAPQKAKARHGKPDKVEEEGQGEKGQGER